MTPIADMVEVMLAADTAPAMIVLAVRAVEVASATVRGMSADISADNADITRAKDRERKRLKRELERKMNLGTEANDAVTAGDLSAEMSAEMSADNADNAENGCNFLSSFSSSESGNREESKKEPKTPRARGFRMSAGQSISDADWEFARCAGFTDAEIHKTWAEFVDFWIGVPGQRGLKLDWSATWRNRVRAIETVNGKHVNGARNQTMAAFDKLIARTESGEVERNSTMRDITPRGA